ncbi:MAG: formate/nitrite transporter family protein [Fimbriimonadales bacterium]
MELVTGNFALLLLPLFQRRIGWGAVLRNWFVVYLSQFLGLTARDTPGKIMAMWLPIFTFFALGFEHSVVNLFLIPAGIMAGAPVSVQDWWVWNQIPVTVGNLLGGALFTAGLLYWTYPVAGTDAKP